jgi:hypothetical protein
MSIRKFGVDKILQGQGVMFSSGARIISGTGFPISGTAGTGVGINGGPAVGSLYIDKTSGVHFQNDGTALSPYWYPVSMDQRGIVGVNTDFGRWTTQDGTSTASNVFDPGTGLKSFGQGLEVNDADTAMTRSYPIGGPLLTFGTTNEADHSSSLGLPGTAGLWKPATNGVMAVECYFTGITDIVTRAFILGFQGDANGAQEEALDPIVTGATVTLTFSAVGSAGDNIAALVMDSRLTAASTIFAVNNKADAAATQTTTAAALTVAATMPAAATYSRWRVEVGTNGTAYYFVDKVLVKTVASALTTTTAVKPVFQMVNTTTTASLQCGIRRFGCWAAR